MKFKVDPKQYNGIKRKILKRIAKIGIPSAILPLLLLITKGAYSSIKDPLHLVILIGGTLLVIGLSLWVGAKQAISNNKSLQIEINSEGVQRIMQGVNFVTIPWNRLDTDSAKTGELILVDKKVNKLLRMWNGKGAILIPNELENYQKFEEIIKQMKKKNELQLTL